MFDRSKETTHEEQKSCRTMTNVNRRVEVAWRFSHLIVDLNWTICCTKKGKLSLRITRKDVKEKQIRIEGLSVLKIRDQSWDSCKRGWTRKKKKKRTGKKRSKKRRKTRRKTDKKKRVNSREKKGRKKGTVGVSTSLTTGQVLTESKEISACCEGEAKGLPSESRCERGNRKGTKRGPLLRQKVRRLVLLIKKIPRAGRDVSGVITSTCERTSQCLAFSRDKAREDCKKEKAEWTSIGNVLIFTIPLLFSIKILRNCFRLVRRTNIEIFRFLNRSRNFENVLTEWFEKTRFLALKKRKNKKYDDDATRSRMRGKSYEKSESSRSILSTAVHPFEDRARPEFFKEKASRWFVRACNSNVHRSNEEKRLWGRCFARRQEHLSSIRDALRDRM